MSKSAEVNNASNPQIDILWGYQLEYSYTANGACFPIRAVTIAIVSIETCPRSSSVDPVNDHSFTEHMRWINGLSWESVLPWEPMCHAWQRLGIHQELLPVAKWSFHYFAWANIRFAERWSRNIKQILEMIIILLQDKFQNMYAYQFKTVLLYHMAVQNSANNTRVSM
jgi:hypothetical protein